MRSLLIAFALLVPVFFIIAMSGKITPAPDIYHNPKKAAKISSKIMPLPKPDDTAPNHIEPGSIDEEKAKLKKRLAELDDMTPEQWKLKREERINFNKKWTDLSREQRLKVFERLREKKKRAPEVELKPARPESDKPFSKGPQ